MPRRLILRILQGILVLFVVSFVIYGLIGLMPGDPVEQMMAGAPNITPEDAARLRAYYGIDQPLITRYLHWLMAALSGDLGFSRLSGLSVLATLRQPLFNSMALMITSMAVSLAIALPLGVVAALRHGGRLDFALNLGAFACLSIPVFWLGLMLILLFAVGLAWLPATGVIAVGNGDLWDRVRHLVLPVAALGVTGSGTYFRFMRAEMTATLRQDWIRTARAKGLSMRQAALYHGLRYAVMPVTTLVGLDLGNMFSGVVVTETVFAYPGMGKLIYDAVMGNDFNLALAALLLATFATLLGNLLADLAYGWLDPRVKFE